MMEKYESDIDPNIFRQNALFLENLRYKPIPEIDEHESITPRTNKGHLDEESRDTFFKKVIKKIQDLKTQNEEKDFFMQVQGGFKNKGDLDVFLENEQNLLESLTTNKVYIKKYQYKESETSKVLRFCINTNHENLGEELRNYNLQLQENIENALEQNLEKKSNISNISGATKYEPFRNKYINC